jgi:hypothetical protein
LPISVRNLPTRFSFLSGAVGRLVYIHKGGGGLFTPSSVILSRSLKANSHMTCRTQAVPLPCRTTLMHTGRAAPRPFSVSFVDVRVISGNIRTATRVGRPHAVSVLPMLIHTSCLCRAHVALCRSHEKSLSERHGRYMAWARHGMCESNTAVMCESNGKGTI